MPAIKIINGIRIYLYYDDHNPPHIHCYKGENAAVIDIRTGIVVAGNIKAADLKEVLAWVADNRDMLLEMWSSQKK